jgi:hypothetical protein
MVEIRAAVNKREGCAAGAVAGSVRGPLGSVPSAARIKHLRRYIYKYAAPSPRARRRARGFFALLGHFILKLRISGCERIALLDAPEMKVVCTAENSTRGTGASEGAAAASRPVY